MRSFHKRPDTTSGEPVREATSKARRNGPNRLTSAIAATAAAATLCAVAMPALAAEHAGANASNAVATAAATTAATAATTAADAATTAYDGVPMGETWYDTEGNPIQAHGGGFLQDGGKYYWVGEDKSHDSANFLAVSLYESTDLLNWTKVGSILTEDSKTVAGAEHGLTDIKLERPKLLKNAQGQYVLYGHWEDATGYSSSQIAVAVADHIEGPYVFQGHWRPGAGIEAQYRNWRAVSGKAGTIQISDDDYAAVMDANPGKSVDDVWDQLSARRITDAGFGLDYDDQGNAVESAMYGEGKYGYGSRDMTLYQDGDEAYLIDAEDHMSMRIHRLSDDLTDVAFTDATATKETMTYRMFQGKRLEAPAMTNIDGTYYLIMSTQSGWYPNQARYYTTSDITDPDAWSDQKLIGNSSTFYSQPTSVMSVTEHGHTSYVYLGDRWNSKKLGSSTYIWLPLNVADDGSLSMTYAPGWKLDKTTGDIDLPDIELVSQNQPVYADAGVPQAGASTAEAADASKANDGKYTMTGFWDEGVEFYAQNHVPYTWTVDLGEVRDLARVDTTFATANGSESRYGYRILGSNDDIASKADADAADWTTLYDNTANTQVAFTSDKVDGKYRYVRLEVTSVTNDHNGNSTADWENGLVEVQVYADRTKQDISALPQIALPSGTYAGGQQTAIAAAEGADIRYTLDGSEPTIESTRYEGPIALEPDGGKDGDGHITLKAVAVEDGKAVSGVVTRKYVIRSADDPQTLVSTALSGAMAEGTAIEDHLPATLAFTTVGGDTVNKKVDWTLPETTPKAFDSIDVTGTVAGYDGTVTYHLEVVPAGLTYFIDSGMAGKTSASYEAVHASTPTLRNETADQQSTDGSWGANIADVSVYSSGSDTDKYNTVLGGEKGGSKKDVVYTLPLSAGTYRFSIGSKELWSGPRSMKLALTYVDVSGATRTVALNGGENLFVGNGYDKQIAYTSDAITVGEGTATLTASHGGRGDAAMVSWVAVSQAEAEDGSGADAAAAAQARATLSAAVNRYGNTVQGHYTDGTWGAFSAVLAKARAALADGAAGADELSDAAQSLSDAAQALRERADMTALNAAIEQVDADVTSGVLVEADYTAESWEALASALTSAKTVASDGEATQSAVDGAWDALGKARAGLVRADAGPDQPEKPGEPGDSGDPSDPSDPGKGDGGSDDGKSDGASDGASNGKSDGAASGKSHGKRLSRTGAAVDAALGAALALLTAGAGALALRRRRG